jgi:hypothetical protein
MMLNVPCGQKGLFLNQKMSYQKFKLDKTSSHTGAEATANKKATITLEYSVSSLIARLKINHDSDLLEQIHVYGLLHTLWAYITGCVDAHITTGNLLEGMGTTARVVEGLAVSDSRYDVIFLLSGIIGCMQSKYLPTGDMSGRLPAGEDHPCE